jgi:hypothetical protein
MTLQLLHSENFFIYKENLIFLFISVIFPPEGCGAGDVLLHRVGAPGEPTHAHQGGRLHTGGCASPLHPPPRRLHEPVGLEQRGPGPEEQTQLFWNHEFGYLQVQLYNLKEIKLKSLLNYLSFADISLSSLYRKNTPLSFAGIASLLPTLCLLTQP